MSVCVLSGFTVVRLLFVLQPLVSSMFSRQECRVGYHFLLQGLSNPQDQACISALQMDSFTAELPGKPRSRCVEGNGAMWKEQGKRTGNVCGGGLLQF